MNDAASDTAICLEEAPVHLQAEVSEIRTDPETAGLLEGLGICAGRKVRLLRRGQAYILSVYGTRVGLAPSVASGIFVTPR